MWIQIKSQLRAARFLMSVILALLLLGCEKRREEFTPKNQELRINLRLEPLCLDPRKANDITSLFCLKMCFDGLIRIGLDGKPQLSLAEKIEISEDQKTYTVSLREALWSDGVAITAYDFESSWKTMLTPDFPCEAVSNLFVLKNARAAKMKQCSVEEVGVKALDLHTLRIELAHPLPSFISMLATHSFYPSPRHIIEKHPEWADKNNPYYISNGPFLLKEWYPSNYLLVEKNPNYWDEQNVKLERIYLYLIEDNTTELSMYNNYELDWIGSPFSYLSVEAMPYLKNVHYYPIAGVYYYSLNVQDTLLKNKALRRALALAINRKEIIDNILQGGQLPATSFLPPCLLRGQYHYNYFQDADKHAAKESFKQALKEMHLTLEEFPTLTLSYNTAFSHHKVAQPIQQQWREVLGITVRLQNKEWKVILDEQRHHKFQIARMGGIPNYPDPMYFLNYFRYLSSELNFSQWTNPTFTEILEKADCTPDPNIRENLMLEAEKILIEEMPLIPIYFYTGSYLRRPYVRDVYLSEISDVDFKWAYVNDKVSR